MTAPARSRSLLSLLALLAAVIGLVASSAVVASASTHTGPETRVRANTPTIETRAGAEHHVLAGGVGRDTRVYDLFVSATGVATEDAALTARANEIHGALDPIAQNSRTTAVMSTREGPNVIASGGRDLSAAQRALAEPGDVLGKLPGAHAEVTAIDAASKVGLTPSQIAVSRQICPACQTAITESGGQVSPSGWWAWWPR